MLAEAREIRNGRPVLTTNCAHGEGIESVAEWSCYEGCFYGSGKLDTQAEGR